MKRIGLFIFLLFVCSTNAFSQDWQHNFEKTKTIAAAENKSIVLVFKGSDWCAPCMKLDQKIFSSDAFKNGYAKHFILLEADFPRKKKNALAKELKEQNNLLASTYNQNGHFPLVVVLDSKGNVLGKTGYNKLSPQAYLDSLIAFTK
ncbi:thioredoxin family protein [Flavicella marina]|uniref:thioredoxin family protein n=1 Tax=Flavicella marina TaxID=1475951 RepID=UPI001265A0E4|nr:thioredoxin family protein [Flavicella marina]